MSRRRPLVALSLVVAAMVGWLGYRAWVGDPQASLEDGWHAGHRIVDRDGSLLRELPSELGARGRPIALEQMGDRLVLATLVSEDKRFYEHPGIDYQGIKEFILDMGRAT